MPSQNLRRTGTTSLTDDELVLFDVLFRADVPVRLLYRSSFAAQWNCRPHGLDDDDLGVTLSQMVERGLLKLVTEREDSTLRFTAEGGRLWELERLPIWERFATETHDEDESGRAIVRISATSADVCEAFWNVGRDVGLFRSADDHVIARTVVNESLIDWKSLPANHVLVAVVEESFPSRTNWQAYEARRTWWRCAQECDKFFGLFDH